MCPSVLPVFVKPEREKEASSFSSRRLLTSSTRGASSTLSPSTKSCGRKGTGSLLQYRSIEKVQKTIPQAVGGVSRAWWKGPKHASIALFLVHGKHQRQTKLEETFPPVGWFLGLTLFVRSCREESESNLDVIMRIVGWVVTHVFVAQTYVFQNHRSQSSWKRAQEEATINSHRILPFAWLRISSPVLWTLWAVIEIKTSQKGGKQAKKKRPTMKRIILLTEKAKQKWDIVKVKRQIRRN